MKPTIQSNLIIYLSWLTEVFLEKMDLRVGCEGCCCCWLKSYGRRLVAPELPAAPLEAEMEVGGRGRARLASFGSTPLTVGI